MRTLSLLPVAMLVPLSLFAQDSTARPQTPFRRGQWATQFSAGSGFASLGFLKFRSPTRALLLDLRINGAHAETLSDDSTGSSQFVGLSSAAFTQLRFGWRRYGVGAPKVATHYTFGVLAGFDHSVERSTTSTSQSNGWTGGLFGDIGATYLVTPNFGLGALASASLTYATRVSEFQPFGGKSHTWQIGGTAVNAALVATLFF